MKASTASARAGSGKIAPPSPRSSVPSAQSPSRTFTIRPSYCLPCQRTPSSRGFRSAGADALGLGHEIRPRLGRPQPVLVEEIAPVVEQPHVHVPRHPPDTPAIGRRLDRRWKERTELVRSELGGEVEQPPRPRELGHPDDVEHHHVEARAVALEVDDEELALLVTVPGQRLGLHVHAGVPRLELRDQLGDGIALAQDMGVLEDQGDGRRRARPIGACRDRAERRDQQAGGQDSAGPGHPITAHDGVLPSSGSEVEVHADADVFHGIDEELAIERAAPVVLRQELQVAAQDADVLERDPRPE